MRHANLCRMRRVDVPCEKIQGFDGDSYEMVGLVPGVCEMQKKLQRVGYVTGKALRKSVIADQGDLLKGHEFHFSTLSCGEDFPGHILFRGHGRRQGTSRAMQRTMYWQAICTFPLMEIQQLQKNGSHRVRPLRRAANRMVSSRSTQFTIGHGTFPVEPQKLMYPVCFI